MWFGKRDSKLNTCAEKTLHAKFLIMVCTLIHVPTIYKLLGFALWSFPDWQFLMDNQASKKSNSWRFGSCPTTLTVFKPIWCFFSWTWQEILEFWSNSQQPTFYAPQYGFLLVVLFDHRLPVVHKMAVDATDFVYCSRFKSNQH